MSRRYQGSILGVGFNPLLAPNAPTNIIPTASGTTTISVAFTAPANVGGSAITSYTVIASNGQTATGATSPIVVSGLSAATSYTFVVYANNIYGPSPASATSASVSTYKLPGAPTSVTATAGQEQAVISFTAPADLGVPSTTSYRVTSSPGGITATGASSPITVTGLTGGTSYTFTVAAQNALGYGPESSASNSVTPTVNPYIGTKLFSAPAQYNNSVSNWTVPANCNYVWFKIWGSGGAPDGYNNGYPGGDGGGGGFTEGVITCTPGEVLNVGIGTVTNNGGASKSFGGSGGGFSGVFRAGSPQLIAGGGGGGQVNGTAAGGAGGGTNGQASSDGVAGGTQTAAGSNGGYLTGGSEGGGGGYYGGGGIAWYYASGGGSGYSGGSIAKTSTVTGNYRTPAGTSDPEYPAGNSPGGLPWAYGGIGNNSGDSSTHGSGYIIAHCYRTNPQNLSYPTTRILL